MSLLLAMVGRSKQMHLNVYLNSRLVGRLAKAASGAISFQYDKEWLNWQHAISVSISMPLRDQEFSGDAVAAVFDNLLPDNQGIRERLASKVGAMGTDAYSLLAAVGRDCVGALQFLPEGANPGTAGELNGKKVSNSKIAEIIANLGGSPLGVERETEFRISIAGAHEKTALLRFNRSWMIPVGATATTHILKPPIGKLRNGVDLSLSVENEYLCLRLCAALGLPTAKCEIALFGKGKALVVERFDRRWTRDGRLLRVPQEDLCQALSYPSTLKYESDGGPGIPQIMNLLRGSDDPLEDRLTFLKAQLVFWLLAAIDGHAKNFSVHLASGGRFRLAPLYDVLSAQPAYDAKQLKRRQLKLAMAVGDRRHYRVETIAPSHFLQTAKATGLDPKALQRTLDELESRHASAIDGVLNSLPKGFPENLADSVTNGMKSRFKVTSLARQAMKS